MAEQLTVSNSNIPYVDGFTCSRHESRRTRNRTVSRQNYGDEVARGRSFYFRAVQ